MSEKTDVEVRHIDQSEECDQIAPPVVVKQFVARDNEKGRRYPVAETVFAGEEVEKLSTEKRIGLLAPVGAIVARLAKDFLVRDRPRNAGHRQCKHEQP